MNNKIIGIVIGVLILGVVIFSGMNNPEMSAPMGLDVRDKIKSTGLTNPEVMPVEMSARDCLKLGCQIWEYPSGFECVCDSNRLDETVPIDTLY